MLPKFKSVLCLNGRLPVQGWFLEYQDLILIAADGAGNKLIDKGITPDFIVGDLDSLDRKYLTAKYNNVIHVVDQNTTDFEKCLVEMQNRSLFPSLILGIAGGEIDHTMYNLNCFMRYAKENILVFLDVDENNKFKWGFPVLSEKKIVGGKGKTISLLPFPEAVVSTIGLRWDMIKTNLSVSENSSIRNVVVSEASKVQVHRGELLVVIDG